MKIGIDARFFRESGIGRYIRNLIANLQTIDYKNEYYIFLLEKDFEKFSKIENFQKVLADFKWYGFAEQFKLPNLLNKYKLDLIHFPHFNVPIFYSGKFVVTVHDLIHQHHQMNRATTLDPVTYQLKQFGYRRVFKTAIFNSLYILTPSNFVKEGLIKEWKIKKDKIVVTYEACDDKLLNYSLNSTNMNLKKPYIFYVGNAHPHKNIEGLIKTFEKLKENHPDLRLVLSGYDHYFWERIKKEFKSPEIYYTGSVSDEELVSLYKNAEMFVMPSFEEGFGIPVLEAMALGCPVVSSNTASLPEVAGDAAIYFDPYNLVDLGNKIDSVLKSEKLRKQLIEKGKKRIKKFSWQKLARQTLEVYQNCV